ncbi:hypothetical protein GWI33_015233 [Rhynchophorus ferrugineus]|uniref:RING finger protein 141 n=1 Tax=Rhynchophorus ferrugineus TaxID=354439 RepID=A0A834M9Y3_RHYFE|nr:hypothetical protein GWI33_015233 [Rhynchophorus ferrugineus]
MGDVVSQIVSDEPTTLLTPVIYSLRHEEFLDLLFEINNFSKRSLTTDGHQLVFAVKKDTDTTVFWKATVQIACAKVDTATKKVLSYRLLTLSEFLKVFKNFQCQTSAVVESKKQMNLADILENVDLGACSDSLDDCVICFERKPDLTLPCTHSFCTQCIEEWNELHDTCPLCRERLESTNDTWYRISNIFAADSQLIHYFM